MTQTRPTSTTPKATWQTWLVSIFTLVLIVSATILAARFSSPDAWRIDQVMIQELPIASLGAVDNQAWTPLTLPDPYCRSSCIYQHKAYRVTFSPSTVTLPAIDFAIYIPRFDSAVEVWLNGDRIGASGRLQPPISDGGYRPQLFTLPTTSLEAGENVITVILAGFTVGGHAFGPVYVGPEHLLTQPAQVGRFIAVDAVAISVGITVMLLAFSLLLYHRMPTDTVFLWFSVLLLAAATRGALRLSPDWPVGLDVRMPIYFLSTLGVVVASTLFLRRLVGLGSNKWEAALLAAAAAVVVFATVAIHQDVLSGWIRGIILSQLLTLIAGSYQVYLLLTRVRRQLTRYAPLVFILFAISIAFVIYDIVITRLYPPLVIPLASLGLLPVMLAFCVAVGDRYATNFERLQADRDRLARERTRIMQDMHDGVGGDLAGLLMRAESGKVDTSLYQQILERSVNDLRMIIDSLDEDLGKDLSSALGNFRTHLQPIMQACGITLNWQNHIPGGIPMSPERLLNTYRILQELANNVVKHASARNVHVEILQEGNRVRLKFADDGVGFPLNIKPGRGLSTLNKRAESMNATLDRLANATGTQWELSFSP